MMAASGWCATAIASVRSACAARGCATASVKARSAFAFPRRFCRPTARSIQVDHRHCRLAANETMLGLRRAVGTEVVHWLGANKPAYKLDPGFLEHPRLSPRAVIGPGARFLDFLFAGAPRRRRSPDVEPRSRYRREFAAWPEQVSF